MSPPQNPIAAATHADPYGYYANLVSERPLAYGDTLGMWVAASAEAVAAVLTDTRCRVRPLAEPVPAPLLGSPAGDLFRRFVRMTDGERHDPIKQAVSTALASVTAVEAAALSRRWAQELIKTKEPNGEDGFVVGGALTLPTYVLGTLLGLPEDALGPTAQWLGAFVRGVAPGSTPSEVERGKQAAGQLHALMHAVVAARETGMPTGLLDVLVQAARRAGCGDADLIAANSIGLMFQAHDATAGLIGNSLLALAEHPELRRQAAVDQDTIDQVTAEVLRFDPPIQNTRRYIARDATVAGRTMQAGDAILVLLAAANRDPAWFVESAQERRIFSFGYGPHACPGAALAMTIARAGIEQVLATDIGAWRLPRTVAYRPSVNARIPLFVDG